MKTHVKALIVGGGAIGTSIAYHLARFGWDDVMLLERDELTSGSTWHAAGLLPLFNMSYAVSHIHDYSVKFYKTLEEETGLNAGLFRRGQPAHGADARAHGRIHGLRLHRRNRGRALRMDDAGQIRERWPLVAPRTWKGAIYHPTDGYINPADVTMAMAKGARQRGVTIERKWQADAYEWTGSKWEGDAHEDGRAGRQPRAVGRTDGGHRRARRHRHRQPRAAHRAPSGHQDAGIPVEHQFIVTDARPRAAGVSQDTCRAPVLRDADAKWYVREERGGWILGPYEWNAPARFEYGVPDSFRADLFPLDLERIEEEYMSMIHRIPSSEEVGSRTITTARSAIRRTATR